MLLRIENYSGDWRENERNGFGIIEIEKYNSQPTCLFPSQTPPRPTIIETLCYEGCWKNGAYDGWVCFNFLVNQKYILLVRIRKRIYLITYRRKWCNCSLINFDTYFNKWFSI